MTGRGLGHLPLGRHMVMVMMTPGRGQAVGGEVLVRVRGRIFKDGIHGVLVRDSSHHARLGVLNIGAPLGAEHWLRKSHGLPPELGGVREVEGVVGKEGDGGVWTLVRAF